MAEASDSQTHAQSSQRASGTIGRPFQKGKSGNPGGRQKIPDDVKEAARALTGLALDTLADICGDKKQPASSRVTAANSILDRALGKPAQAVELSGKDGGPIETADTTSLLEFARRAAFLLRRASQSEDKA